ncbi:MAG: hypothetical protein BWY95_01889 [Bacteroidetes bacterium ADurb.BinA104]|nr:MAG: hypothetical protein BWY95_01889 [Bacteroidetes bacterium ADurb.BinA104]
MHITTYACNCPTRINGGENSGFESPSVVGSSVRIVVMLNLNIYLGRSVQVIVGYERSQVKGIGITLVREKFIDTILKYLLEKCSQILVIGSQVVHTIRYLIGQTLLYTIEVNFKLGCQSIEPLDLNGLSSNALTCIGIEFPGIVKCSGGAGQILVHRCDDIQILPLVIDLLELSILGQHIVFRLILQDIQSTGKSSVEVVNGSATVGHCLGSCRYLGGDGCQFIARLDSYIKSVILGNLGNQSSVGNKLVVSYGIGIYSLLVNSSLIFGVELVNNSHTCTHPANTVIYGCRCSCPLLR